MFNVQELMEYRMQQQIAQEIYRQQIMQRIPDPFPQMLPLGMPAHHMMVPAPRPTLPGNVEAKLENNDLWQQFHKIGTEMIITKSGRRMFPSMRVSVKGLEEESQYCVLLEMVPIGDCRYKFSGSQWVPAGGAEPQSPQRMFLHPDSPSTGSHWQSQTILFNKVKLTNNTMDNSGHIVLASMHKYQPRLHIIKTSDLSQLPWAPQQNYVFPETEFIAVTAYQNDRITKLKIDNNPFAKGFRETGQSKCKRKMMSSSSSSTSSSSSQHEESDDCLSKSEDDRSSVSSFDSPPQQKRLRSLESSDEESSPQSLRYEQYLLAQHKQQQQQQLQAQYMNSPTSSFYHPHQQQLASSQFMQQHLQSLIMDPLRYTLPSHALQMPANSAVSSTYHPSSNHQETKSLASSSAPSPTPSSSSSASSSSSSSVETSSAPAQPASQKRNNFSISAILAY
ncbi:T-box-containing protein TBX6L-like [Lucilia cuprina]|uniref:T-box-containing protein TBX6L-like n=1 Tax=Lucilia cuprina TaxID=7375 RepID=UPI001F05D327|nr:T-box-containing protein TBX6L-like [Lucilia cuprina]